LVVAIDRGLLDQPEEVFALLMFVHFVSSEKHLRSHTKNHESKDKIFLLLRECYSIVTGRRWRRTEQLLYSISCVYSPSTAITTLWT